MSTENMILVIIYRYKNYCQKVFHFYFIAILVLVYTDFTVDHALMIGVFCLI